MKYIYKPSLFKTKAIFENVVKKPIIIKFNGKFPSVLIRSNRYIINMPPERTRFIKQCTTKEYYRSFEHELSHIVFNSPSPESVIVHFPNVPIKLVHAIFNIIEDHRVDYLWNQLYRGSKIVREKMLAKRARELVQSDHIVDIINAVRCDPNMIKKIRNPEIRRVCEEFLNILKRVEGKSWKASVVATVETLKLLEKYLKNEIVPPEPQPQSSISEEDTEENTHVVQVEQEEQEYKEDSEEQTNNEQKNSGEPDVIDTNTETDIDTDTEMETETNTETESGEVELEDDETETKTSTESEKTLKNEIDSLDTEALESITVTDDPEDIVREETPGGLEIDVNKSISEIYKEAEEEGQMEFNRVKQELFRYVDVDPEKLESKRIYGKISEDIQLHNTPFTEPDRNLAKHIAKAIRTIKFRDKIDTDITGTDIDIDEYIRYRITRNAEPFETEETDSGFNIIILLDVSGSMSGIPIRIAANACATLYMAMKQINGINLSVIAYTMRRRTVYLRELKNENEICRVCTSDLTPTWSAVQYATNKLSKTNGKKMILIITDGVPEGIGSHEKTFPWTRAAIQRARKSGIDVFTLFINTNSYVTERTIKYVFGPEWTWEIVEDPEQLPKKLYSLVTNKIVKNFGR